MNSNSLRIERLDASRANFSGDIAKLRRKLSPDGSVVSERGRQLTLSVFGEALSPQSVVERICNDVRDRGTSAVLQYARALDNKETTSDTLRVPAKLLEQAHANASPEFLNTIRRIRANIVGFQSAILHKNTVTRPSPGVVLEQRYTPLHRVGICVPGGAAAYPSTVLMTAIPAQCAGVEQIAIVAPPTSLGAYNPDVLAVCCELGIQEIYAVGGAQAVAAMAYGIPEIPGVDKIVGPGNLFVALAKRFVYGTVDIDSIAGPSEVVVIADETTNADFAASDMLAQAEHSPGASIVVSWDNRVLDRVEHAMARQLMGLERAELTLASLNDFGAMILCRDEAEACEVTSLIAPEHLQIAVEDPRRLLAKIRNAGATFLGHYSPVALGDYAAGPSHVLPTGGTARWAAGLSSNHFLRSSSVIEFDQVALQGIASDIALLADKEGLTAHKNSVVMRLKE
ncbi:MAG: histidinol dehydrogenase [Planctomycetota bacterium]|nr:histidinol dehydrogenase [Planctomycetota bacterium]